MQLAFEGWSRSHGKIVVSEHDLTKTETGKAGTSTRNGSHPIMILKNDSDGDTVEGVSVHWYGQVRLGGEYEIMISLSKKEIARLFYLTHQPEVDGLVKALPIAQKPEVDGLAKALPKERSVRRV